MQALNSILYVGEKLVSDIQGRTLTEGAWKEGADENIWS
jgi:hypothetical protein